MVTYKSKCIKSNYPTDLAEQINDYLNKNCGDENWIIHDIHYSTVTTGINHAILIYTCLIILMQK